MFSFNAAVINASRESLVLSLTGPKEKWVYFKVVVTSTGYAGGMLLWVNNV